jgi:hypothetical protein
VTKSLRKQLKGGRIHFGTIPEVSAHGWLVPLILSLQQVRSIMVQGHGGRSSSPHGNQEAKRLTERGKGQDTQVPTPTIYFFQQGPTS